MSPQQTTFAGRGSGQARRQPSRTSPARPATAPIAPPVRVRRSFRSGNGRRRQSPSTWTAAAVTPWRPASVASFTAGLLAASYLGLYGPLMYAVFFTTVKKCQ
ncbi:hypothetical protein Pka01_07350 [Planotetraspora kaengkrachanensis]|uniref:Uncharacterized protein n=1 Tax=Planotetraspora kaengkrachanensis TaxID=575193 RepID=A0A8J3LW51_9ACTN|nr:hypothetical protein Pka01_07350 [Planotetraspora kaengkrachanensis]